jgi:hypothetical protein
MKNLILAAIFAAVVAGPALAAEESYYIVKDAVGNCDVTLSYGENLPGMKVISKGYSSGASARQEVSGIDECKNSATPY